MSSPDLMGPLNTTRSVSVQVDLNALRHNLSVARQCSAGSRVFATIKANAYGHGAVAVAKALSSSIGDAADGFAVVSLNEALELRESGITSPILVMQGPQTEQACIDMERQKLWPVIHDLSQYNWYKAAASSRRLSAWLKVDTGMGRLGVSVEDANHLLSSEGVINWMGVMTHFACADETNNSFTQTQLEKFNAIEASATLQCSLANSAAVLAWPQTHADWVRPGIMLYGCNPLAQDLPPEQKLQPVMSVSAPLISIKGVSAGSGIGYAQTWFCPEDMPVGYAAIGYGDGLPRVLDDTATVSIRGHRCPIIGRVSMDSIALDMRALPNAQAGEAVELWGNSASIDALARSAATINYELLTSIRGKRIYIS